MIMMNSNYQYSSHQFPPFSIDLNQDHQHYLNAHYFTTAITTATTTTTSSSPSSSSSSPLPNYHIFINPPPPATQYSGEDTDPGGHLDYSSWGLPPPAAAAAAASFHQYHQPPQILLQKGGSSCMYDQEMVEVVDYNHNGSLDKMEKEMSYDVVSPKLRIMNQKKKKLTIKTNVKKPNNLNDVQSPSTLQLQPAAMTDNTTNTTAMTTTTSSNSPTAGSPTVRVCSDCNTTKTPLWRSGPQGPKSLCNACGIRQRKARRAMAAAAAAIADGGTTLVTPPPSATIKLKTTSSSSSLCKKSKKSNKIGEWTNKEMKKKRNNNLSAPQPSSNNSHLPLKKRRKFTAASRKINITTTTTTTTTVDGVCSNKTNKVCFDDLAAIFSNSNMINSYQRVFPQDEKEAAILLMALSYGLVRT